MNNDDDTMLHKLVNGIRHRRFFVKLSIAKVALISGSYLLAD